MSGNKRWCSSQYDHGNDDWGNQQSTNKKQAYQSPQQHTPQFSNYGGLGTPQSYPVGQDDQNWRGRSSCDPPRTSQQLSFPSMQERSRDALRSPQFSLPFLQDQGNEVAARSSYPNSQSRGNSSFPSIQDRAGTRGQISSLSSTFPTLEEASQSLLLQQNRFPDPFRSLPAMGQPNLVVKQEQQQDRPYMQQNRNFPTMDQARMRVKQEPEEDMHQEQTAAAKQETNRSFPATNPATVKQEPGTSRNQKPPEEQAESSDSSDLDDLDELDDHRPSASAARGEKPWFHVKLHKLEEPYRKLAASLWCSHHLSDFKFVIGKGRGQVEIPAHRFLLAAVSPKLSLMFKDNPNMQQMSLESKPDRVKKFLKTVYMGELIANHILLANVLEIATTLGVEGLTHEKCPPYEQCPKYMQVIMYSHYGRNPHMSKPGTKSTPGTNRIQPAPAKTRNKPPGQFLCGKCEDDFEREIVCQMHDMLAHGTKFSQCLMCVKLLSDDAALDNHYRQEHSTEVADYTKPMGSLLTPNQLSKGMTCEVCSYMFPRRLMKAHLWFIHKVPVYPCNLCNKSFAAEDQARTHSSLIHGRLLKLI